MSLDPTAREANIRDSIKKYLVDSLETIEGIELTFDRTLSTPDLRSLNTNRWVSVAFGSLSRETLSSMSFDLFCCTRRDEEGFRLAQLTDTVMGYLTDNTSTDGMRKINFYRSSATEAWSSIGGIAIQEIIESAEMDASDETKYKILTVRCRFGSKV